MKIVIIGGGAGGFFSAINAKLHHREAEVVIYEKTNKLLSKVKVSGGGRCNVTNAAATIPELITAYPRGGKKLNKVFHQFSNQDTIDWFESRGVGLTTQENGHIFTAAQDSQVVIDCFMNQCKQLGIEIIMNTGVLSLKKEGEKFQLELSDGSVEVDKVIVATGGSPKRAGLQWLEDLGHEIEEPVPSLFTFNMPSESITELMGVVVEPTLTSVQGNKLKGDGPLLITHWGMSGPAILKLSAFGARILSEMNYEFKLQVNWVNDTNNENVREIIHGLQHEHPAKQLGNIRPYFLPERLWHYLLNKAELALTKRWDELGKKGINKLINLLTNDVYEVSGKTTFKEEFVTCGGVSLNSVDMNTMQSKVTPGLYFTGEVLDIDGITGGYNFQSCWSTAYVASLLK